MWKDLDGISKTPNLIEHRGGKVRDSLQKWASGRLIWLRSTRQTQNKNTKSQKQNKNTESRRQPPNRVSQESRQEKIM